MTANAVAVPVDTYDIVQMGSERIKQDIGQEGVVLGGGRETRSDI